jgi:hypothetical protein
MSSLSYRIVSCPVPFAWLLCDIETNRHEYCRLVDQEPQTTDSSRTGTREHIGFGTTVDRSTDPRLAGFAHWCSKNRHGSL